jgi:hypothetical protein
VEPFESTDSPRLDGPGARAVTPVDGRQRRSRSEGLGLLRSTAQRYRRNVVTICGGSPGQLSNGGLLGLGMPRTGLGREESITLSMGQCFLACEPTSEELDKGA